MRLEEAIQQSHFRNERHKVVLNIYYTNCFIISRLSEFFKKYNLTPQQYNILRILRGQKGKAICIGEIKKRMLDKNSDVSRLVERLRLKKLVERMHCPTDRRQMHVKITAKGLQLLQRMAEVDELAIKTVGLSEKEATRLNVLLDKLRGRY